MKPRKSFCQNCIYWQPHLNNRLAGNIGFCPMKNDYTGKLFACNYWQDVNQPKPKKP